jgi:hypothetical protein
VADGEQNIKIKLKHAELSLEQAAELLPGLSKLMLEIGDRYWILYYAAKGGNWPMAARQAKALAKLFKRCSMIRPDYAKMMDGFVKKFLDPMGKQIEAKNFAEFERLYKLGVDVANSFHVSTNHPEIVWKLPDTPPPQFDLGAPKT